jgi:hypothetical protein
MENVVIFYDHLEYFMAIWHNVWQFGIVCGRLVYFSQFGMFGPRKIWQPWMVYLFSNQNSQFGKKNFRVLQWKMLVYFVAIRYILWPSGIFCGHFGIFCGCLVYFMVIWNVAPRKIWQPCFETALPRNKS